MTKSGCSNSDLKLILAEIQERTGIQFRDEQRAHLQRVLGQLMTELKIESGRMLVRALQTDMDVFHYIIDAVTVGETYFFREPKHFEFVRTRVLRDWRVPSAPARKLRIWSAGCAAGEEAYSLAILCNEQAQPAEILATDISPAAIAKAQRGGYRQWSFRGDSLPRAEKYLRRSGNAFVIDQSIRRRVRFELLNLASDEYPDPRRGLANFDLIFCRNVLIYFTPTAIDAVARRLASCLQPGGWLVTASSDPPLRHIEGLESVSTEQGTFYRRPADPAPQTETADRSLPPLSKTPAAERSSFPKTSVRHRSDSADHPAQPPQKLAEIKKVSSSDEDELADSLSEVEKCDARACAAFVRAAAHSDLATALNRSAQFASLHPLDCELHYLNASYLLERDRLSEAAQAAQKALFLDRSSVMSHFLFATIQIQRSRWQSARRHFENARKLCALSAAQDPVPWSDNETAAEVSRAAESQLARLNRL